MRAPRSCGLDSHPSILHIERGQKYLIQTPWVIEILIWIFLRNSHPQVVSRLNLEYLNVLGILQLTMKEVLERKIKRFVDV